jgi:hypothetical protein
MDMPRRQDTWDTVGTGRIKRMGENMGNKRMEN